MTEGKPPPPPQDFEARLKALRAKADERTGQGQRSDIPRSAMGYAFRIGVELVAGLVVGGGIGWLLDQAFGTLPLFLILFFFLGSAAGVLNVYRAVRQMERAARQDEEDGN